MSKEHHYHAKLKWTGNSGKGTQAYTSYSRNHEVSLEGKPTLDCSSDPAFRGDKTKYNPEDLFLSSLASCHMLWYLHLCTVNKITVTTYEDSPEGIMAENKGGSGQFTKITLKPLVTIQEENKITLAKALHHEANKYCFIANSVNFPVLHDAEVSLKA